MKIGVFYREVWIDEIFSFLIKMEVTQLFLIVQIFCTRVIVFSFLFGSFGSGVSKGEGVIINNSNIVSRDKLFKV